METLLIKLIWCLPTVLQQETGKFLKSFSCKLVKFMYATAWNLHSEMLQLQLYRDAHGKTSILKDDCSKHSFKHTNVHNLSLPCITYLVKER